MRKDGTDIPDGKTGDYTAPKEKKTYFLARILCILCALVIWLYVMETENPDYEFTFHDIPVKLVNTDKIERQYSLAAYDGYDQTVDVTLKGRKSEMSKISADEISVTADVGEVSAASAYHIDLNVTVPSNLTVVSSSKTSIDVNIDKTETKIVEVKPLLTAYIIESSYKIGETAPSVTEVSVTGPSVYLKDIEYAQAVIPDLGKMTKSLTVYCDIVLIDAAGSVAANPYLKLSQTEIGVFVPLYAYKAVPLSVEYVHNYFTDKNVKINISPSAVYVKGDAQRIDALQTIVVAKIDEKSMTVNKRTFSEALLLPDDIENLDGVETIRVTVTTVGTQIKDFIIPLNDNNVKNPGNLNYSLPDATLKISLRGTRADLLEMGEWNVKPVIDLSAYSSENKGTFNVPAMILIDKNNADVYEVGEYSVRVIIK